MFCPQCQREDVEGITECAACQVSLVESIGIYLDNVTFAESRYQSPRAKGRGD